MSSSTTNHLTDPWSESDLWQVVRSGSALQLDETAANLLRVTGENNPVAAADLAKLGPSIAIDTEIISCGQWLDRCFTDHQPGDVLLRCATDNDSILDASLQGDTLRVRNSPIARRRRQLRHELTNRMNNIHVNAQLIRLWARQQNDDSLLQASQRVLNECADALDSAAASLGALSADEGPQCDVAAVLPSLLYRAREREPGLAVAIQHSATIEAGTLLHVAHFLNRIAQRTARPLACRTEAVTSSTALDITVRDIAIADVGRAILEREWHSRDEDQLALPNMSRAVRAFTLTCSGEQLRLTIN